MAKKKQASGDEPLKDKRCDFCGKAFTPTHHEDQFCSQYCDDAANNEIDRFYAEGAINVSDFYDD